MSILIKGMDMPKEGGVIVIYKESNSFYTAKAGEGKKYPLIPVPSHGDLIERNALEKRIKAEGVNQAEQLATRFDPVVRAYGDCYGMVQNAPTIIEAEEKMSNDGR